MHINHDDIVALATDTEQTNRNDALLASMDREIVGLWSQVRRIIFCMKREMEDGSEEDMRIVVVGNFRRRVFFH